MKRGTLFVLAATLGLAAPVYSATGTPAQSKATRPSAPQQVQVQGFSLQDTLKAAFAYSPSLQQVQESRQQAIHEVRRAQAGFYPTIGAWAGAGFMQGDDVSTRARSEDRDVVGTGTVGFQISQPLWQGGTTSAAVRSRKSMVEARTWQVMDNATTLAFSAVSAHADVLRRRILLDLASANVKEHEKILKLLQARFNQGLSSLGDVEQVKSRLARAEATRVMHRTGLDAALATYMRVTGQAVPAALAPVGKSERPFADEDAVRNASTQTNPRILAELANIRAALGEKDYARGRFSPTVSLDAGPSYSDWGRSGKSYQWTWSTMLNMRWDLYSGGADEAGYQAASAKVREARKSLHQSMDILDEEIRLTFARTRDAGLQSDLYGKAKITSRSARKNFFIQFEAGQKDLLNVLDAESEYFYAAVEECINATDAILGQYRLLALAGTLLDATGMNLPGLQTPPEVTIEPRQTNFFTPSVPDPKDGRDSTLHRMGN